MIIHNVNYLKFHTTNITINSNEGDERLKNHIITIFAGFF